MKDTDHDGIVDACDEDPSIPDTCTLRVARSRVFVYKSKPKTRLVVKYKTRAPAKVTTTYKAKLANGKTLKLGSLKKTFKTEGTFKLPISLSEENAGRWHALALAVTCADLVGAARGAHALACEYAKVREQYGATIGSYQAVGHLLAESLALIEGSISVLRHAAWAVDELPAAEAIEAARVAKIYCARAALTVCETSIQVHGGIGNTWECLAHVYLRRVLTATGLWPVTLEELTIGLS